MTTRTISVLAISGALTVLFLFLTASTRIGERNRHDKPRAAEEYFLRQRMFPTNSIPADWYDRARLHIDAMNRQGLAKAGEWRWVSLGPTNVAGRFRALAMDPTNPAVLYGGAAGGGIWKTTDAGASWQALSDFVPNLRIGSIAVNPFQPAMVLAGNGEGFVSWQGGQAYGRGVYRSLDAGATWSLIAGTATSNFEYVFDIAFDPFTSGTVLASTARGIMRSTDNGDTWTRVISAGTGNRGMQTAFSRTTEGLVYGAIEHLGIYRSTDHGVTWTLANPTGITIPTFTRITLAPAPSNGDILYSAFTAEEDESCAGMFRSTDRGSTWQSVTIPINAIEGNDYMGNQGQYNSVLVVHPTNPNTVIAGGIDLYRTTNGGQSWRQISNWYTGTSYPYVHADQHAVVFNPQSPGEFFAANDGGLFRTLTSGSVFEEMTSGLVTAQFHSGTPHPTSDLVIGGTIDNGNLRVTSGSNWADVTGGDGGWTAIDYTSPNIMYSELYYLHFMKSTNGGVDGSWRVKMSGIPRASDYGTSDEVNFMAPFEMDENTPKILYAGTNKIYRTTDGAEHWTAVSGVISGTGVISTIGLAKSDAKVVYAGGTTGMLQVTTDGCATWARAITGLPTRYITDIAVDRQNAATAYLTVSGFSGGHVYMTTNFGAVWTNISGTGATGLPDVPANTIVLHPTKSGVLFVGTDVGLFQSTDAGATWSVNNDGLGNVTIADLQFRRDGVLFAATHGRGMYRSDYSLTDTQRIPAVMGFTLGQNYPNPTSVSLGGTAIPYELPVASAVQLLLYDATGRHLRTVELGYQAPGSYNHHLSTNGLGAGMYLYRLVVNGVPSEARKMVVRAGSPAR